MELPLGHFFLLQLDIQYDAVIRGSTLTGNFGTGDKTFYLHSDVVGVGIRSMNTRDNHDGATPDDIVVDALNALAKKTMTSNPHVTLGTWQGVVS
jgi:hypothetical protein